MSWRELYIDFVARGQDVYFRWAKAQGHEPYPPIGLDRFVGHLAADRARPSTVRQDLAAIHHCIRDVDLEESHLWSVALRDEVKVHRRECGRLRRRARLPATSWIVDVVVTRLRTLVDLYCLADRMTVTAACALAYVGALRIGQLTHEAGCFNPVSDITRGAFENRGHYATVTLPISRTDPFQADVKIIIPEAHAEALLGPLSLMRDYLRIVPNKASAPLFFRQEGRAFPRGWFVNTLQRPLSDSDLLHTQYDGISFRRGLARWAKLVPKLPDEVITVLGRWSSADVKQYKEAVPESMAKVVTLTLQTGRNQPIGLIPEAQRWWGDE